jgi:hypothetical protein
LSGGQPDPRQLVGNARSDERARPMNLTHFIGEAPPPSMNTGGQLDPPGF